MLPCATGEPTWNMALDEALFELAPTPTLRFYRWSPPGLSLGWFQRWQAVADLPGPHVVVRRLTGGGAIYHDDEITFSITGPLAAMPWADPIDAGYDRLHDAIARALRGVGVDAERAANRGRRAPSPDELWCFSHPAHSDLLGPDGSKLLGSAQRRRRTPEARLLHHGSLPLSRPSHPAEGTSAVRVQAPDLDEAALVAALTEELAAAMDLAPRAGSPTEAELALARRLRDQRYRSLNFVRRR